MIMSAYMSILNKGIDLIHKVIVVEKWQPFENLKLNNIEPPLPKRNEYQIKLKRQALVSQRVW